MLTHNFTIITRNFKRHKGTFFINLIGLSSGLACSLLIYLWVNDEIYFDKIFENDERIFQVMENQSQAGAIITTPETTGILAETLEAEVPEIEYAATATPTFWFENTTLSVGENNVKAPGKFAGKDYFNIFSFSLLEGNRSTLLEKSSIVISAELAKKLFNRTDGLIGKTIEFQHKKQYQVSGVFKDIPTNASDKFQFVLSFEEFRERRPGIMNWGNYGPNTFVRLKDGVEASAVTSKIEDLIKRKSEEKYRTLFLTRYSDNYLYGRYENGVQTGGRIEYVKLFSIISLVILAIACINFMNLSTAKALRRGKEVGIKKVLGARRQSLAFQFIGEAMLMSLLSSIVALIIVYFILPQFNQITDKQIALVLDARVVLAVVGITLFTGFVAGSYPAFYLSSFNPALVLKGRAATSIGELWARKGLVVFQFALSVILIVAVLVVYKQIEYVQGKNLGYSKDNVIYFDREGRLNENIETFIDQVKSIPGVINASSIQQSIVGSSSVTSDLFWEGKDPNENVTFELRDVDYDILETLGMKLAQGRSFSKNFGADNTAIIFNETAIQTMGLKDPVGKTVKLWNEDRQIIGVIKDFHFASLHESVKPLFFKLAPENTATVMVKIDGAHVDEVLAGLQSFYHDYNPGFTLDYKFLDREYEAQYAAEKRVAVLSRYFALLAIVISCLGLSGLAAFSAERRLKEIGIRKIHGSTNAAIFYLMYRDFTKIVVVAIAIALPLSYLLSRRWLNGFVYKIELQPWFFIGAAVVVILISWITVGVHAFRAATVKPLQNLRGE